VDSGTDRSTEPAIVTFRVNARVGRGAAVSKIGVRHSVWAAGMSRGSGKLMIAPGRITLTPERLTRFALGIAALEHTDPTITLLHANPGWPWWNTGVILRDGEWAAAAVTWFGARRRLRAALMRAGFSVRERQTSFSMSERNWSAPWWC